MPARFTKDPDAVLDYQVNWFRWLIEGDFITAVAFDPDSGITVEDSSFTDTTTTVWLSGGTVGVTYKVVCHITTDAGREDDRTLQIAVKEL